MASETLWDRIGFRESPYATRPIPATREGASLLVGRDAELGRLKNRLKSSSKHPTIEGDNGVGKTSLVSVASYQLMDEYKEGSSDVLLVPMPDFFQLSTSMPVVEFRRQVFFAVAQQFIKNHDYLKRSGRSVPKVDRIKYWLNEPMVGGGGFSVEGNTPAGGGGLGLERTRDTNGSAGFDQSGFESTITKWLEDCFPEGDLGGFVCVIDNLELLQTSSAARQALEDIRDTLLSVQGLRWVLCGARGIVRAVASSTRLEGRLHRPIEIPAIPDDAVGELVDARIRHYRVNEDAVAPVGAAGFKRVYATLHQNLRNTLSYCEDFCFWMDDEGHALQVSSRVGLLQEWLDQEAQHVVEAVSLTTRTWELFDAIAHVGGSCSPGDYEKLGFSSFNLMRRYVKTLEDVGFVDSAVDESDRRRRTIVISPKGWLALSARVERNIDESMSDIDQDS